MTSGYPSDATENSVQADIVAAKYATTPSGGGAASTTTGAPTTTSAPSGGGVSAQSHYGQCGGSGVRLLLFCPRFYECWSDV
jgi:hypothetical protein